MGFVTAWRYGSGDLQSLGECSARPQRLVAGAAIACIAFACSWTLMINLAGPDAGAIDVSGTVPDSIERSAARGDNLAAATQAARNRLRTALSSAAVFFDPRLAMGRSSSDSFAADAPAQPRGWSIAAAPAQTAVKTARAEAAAAPRAEKTAPAAAAPQQPRPAQTRMAALRDGAHQAVNVAVTDTRGFFEKLFGKPGPAFALAYADADASGLAAGRNPALGLYDRNTAVYDISAHKVYLPDGSQLEAHSGLGELLDDPRHADVKNRGVTPPAIYDLQPREALFHGVEALRLIPEDESQALGRSGLLAHTYMLGPNGDSNGCVSFKDYEAFLRAYKNHEITRLAVVTRL
jgi:hypothetical protein